MTTIAYRDGILVADSQVTFGAIRTTSDPKIKQLPNGVVIAAAGDNAKTIVAMQFFSRPDWREKIEDAPDFKKGFEAIVVSEGRVYTCQNNCIAWPLGHTFHAAGSGWQIAHTAMHLGKTAEEAVKIASELDIYTSGTLQVVNVNGLLKNEQDVPQKTEAKRAGRGPRRKVVPEA